MRRAAQAGDADPSMLVVSDLEDVYLPKPSDLMVNLTECRPAIESFLGRLSDMFKDAHTVGNALGPAMQAAHKMIVGGFRAGAAGGMVADSWGRRARSVARS